ncbi:MAG: rRNA maturation RNase YbeY [Symploca sp. SIO2E9]|nr:rRNA maturation RNase YbeY [Symploca sp. SIO2E9]
MQVELNVQDLFFTQSPSVATDAQPLPCKISHSTWENWFRQWLKTMCRELPSSNAYELSLRFTDNTEIQALNAQYRHQNQPTDVLAFAVIDQVSFPQLPVPIQLSMPLYLGDIVISVETAHQQAQRQGHALTIELAWLASHGLLHLLGWDHRDQESLITMLNQQETLLRLIGLKLRN